MVSTHSTPHWDSPVLQFDPSIVPVETGGFANMHVAAIIM